MPPPGAFPPVPPPGSMPPGMPHGMSMPLNAGSQGPQGGGSGPPPGPPPFPPAGMHHGTLNQCRVMKQAFSHQIEFDGAKPDICPPPPQVCRCRCRLTRPRGWCPLRHTHRERTSTGHRPLLACPPTHTWDTCPPEDRTTGPPWVSSLGALIHCLGLLKAS